MNVKRYVMKKLIESLLFEGIVEAQWSGASCTIATKRNVQYIVRGRRVLSFGRVRLADEWPLYCEGTVRYSCDDFYTFLRDTVEMSEAKLARLVEELEATVQHDEASREAVRPFVAFHSLAYEQLESWLYDGHPYHPCYKSRLGWDEEEHRRYAPEFARPFQLAEVELSDGRKVLLHPWQWERWVKPRHNGAVRFIGWTNDYYTAQQSLRTLTNLNDEFAPYVKTALNIANTSTARILKPPSVVTAQVVSDWLVSIVSRDDRLANVVLLREYGGVVLDVARDDELYGSIAMIYRENINVYRRPTEDVVPFHALYSKQENYFVAPWLERYGTRRWLEQLVDVAVIPLVHLVLAHGLALESHGQNMMIMHEQGWPVRLALKDFHEGVEYYRPYVQRPDEIPPFATYHEAYATAERDEYFAMERPEALQQMILDALFLYNMSELFIMFAEQKWLSEEECWTIVLDAIEGYLNNNPSMVARAEEIGLFAPTYWAESLTKRKVTIDVESNVHEVKNPLYEMRKVSNR